MSKVENKILDDRGGSWSNKEIEDLVRMWREGVKNSDIAKNLKRSPNAISVKASRIGLPPKDKISDMSSSMKIRQCLKCRGPFFSDGPGNRICGACKNTDEWKSGGGYRIIN